MDPLSPRVTNGDGGALSGWPTRSIECMPTAKVTAASDLDPTGQVSKPVVMVDAGIEPDAKRRHAALTASILRGDLGALVAGIMVRCKRKELRMGLAKSARAAALAKYSGKHEIEVVLARLPALQPAAKP